MVHNSYLFESCISPIKFSSTYILFLLLLLAQTSFSGKGADHTSGKFMELGSVNILLENTIVLCPEKSMKLVTIPKNSMW